MNDFPSMFCMVRKHLRTIDVDQSVEFQSGIWLPRSPSVTYILRRVEDDRAQLIVRLHSTDIVTYQLNLTRDRVIGYEFTWGGWFTKTTASWLNRALDIWRTNTNVSAQTIKLPGGAFISSRSPFAGGTGDAPTMEIAPTGRCISRPAGLRRSIYMYSVRVATHSGALRRVRAAAARGDKFVVDCERDTIALVRTVPEDVEIYTPTARPRTWRLVEQQSAAYLTSCLGADVHNRERVREFLDFARARYGVYSTPTQSRQVELLNQCAAGVIDIDEFAGRHAFAIASVRGQHAFDIVHPLIPTPLESHTVHIGSLLPEEKP